MPVHVELFFQFADGVQGDCSVSFKQTSMAQYDRIGVNRIGKLKNNLYGAISLTTFSESVFLSEHLGLEFPPITALSNFTFDAPCSVIHNLYATNPESYEQHHTIICFLLS